jgi:hypothetical protein
MSVAGLELEEKLRDAEAASEELRAQERHEDDLARLEARGAAATELSELTEECDQRIAQAESDRDEAVAAVTSGAEAQVAEAWAAVEEQASVAARALRTSALHFACLLARLLLCSLHESAALMADSITY